MQETQRLSGPQNWLARMSDSPYRTLLILYAVAFLVRRTLVFASGELPMIMPDEMRYLHIANSLATSGEILIRQQPTAYTHILYPLLILPLRWLPEGVNMFRAIQILNILFMHASIFPAYALSLRLTGNRRASLCLAALVLLLPDMVLTRNLMTENVGFPLILTTFIAALRMFEKPEDIKRWALTGVLVFLLYSLKPVYLVIGAAFGLVALLYALIKRDRALFLGAGVFAASMALLYLLLQLALKFLLKVDMAQTTLYGTQTAPFSWDHILQTIKGTQIYVYYYLVAFGVFPVVVLLSLWKRLNAPRKMLALSLMIATLLVVLCTVYIIYVDELIYQNGIPLRIHVRYAAPLFPIFLMFLMREEAKGLRLGGSAAVVMTLVALGAVFYPASLLHSTSSYPVDAMMLAQMKGVSGAWDGYQMWLPLWLSAILPVLLLSMKDGVGAKARRYFFAVMVMSLVLNQYGAYKQNTNTGLSDYVWDAKQVVTETGGSALMIVKDGQETWNHATAIDVMSRCQIPVFSLGDLMKHTQNDGTLTSVLPSDMGRYVQTKPTYAYAPAPYLVFDRDILNTIAFEGQARWMQTDKGTYAITAIQPGSPWIHSALLGLDNRWVQEGSRFVLYNQALRQKGRVKLMLYARAGQYTATLHVSTLDGQSQSVTMNDQLSWYAFELDIADPAVPLNVPLLAEGGNIYLDTYLVE